MPQVFKIGSYWVYFWSNENDPLEPIHVHVAQGSPTGNATAITAEISSSSPLLQNQETQNTKAPDSFSGAGRNIFCMLDFMSLMVLYRTSHCRGGS